CCIESTPFGAPVTATFLPAWVIFPEWPSSSPRVLATTAVAEASASVVAATMNICPPGVASSGAEATIVVRYLAMIAVNSAPPTATEVAAPASTVFSLVLCAASSALSACASAALPAALLAPMPCQIVITACNAVVPSCVAVVRAVLIAWKTCIGSGPPPGGGASTPVPKLLARSVSGRASAAISITGIGGNSGSGGIADRSGSGG